MRDYRDAKAMAQSLRQALTAKSVTVTHSDSLELIAKSFGLGNWNILAAKIGEDEPPPLAEAGVEAGPTTHHCSFCNKSQHEVTQLIAGPGSFICNECVGLCANIIDHGDIVRPLMAARAADPDADLYPAAERLLSGRSAEDLADYRSRTERHVARGRDGVASIDRLLAHREQERSGRTAEPVPPVDAFLLRRSDEQLIVQKRHLERQLVIDEEVLALAIRVLEARPQG